MSIQAVSRISAGVPDGGRFAPSGRAEADDEFDGIIEHNCLKCGGQTDQDEGIPCSNCLDDMCPCGASLDDGEGYDGRCGGCADQAAGADDDQPCSQDEADREEEAAQGRVADLHHLPDPVEGSEEWQAAIESSIAEEVRRQRPDAIAWKLAIDDDDPNSYDSIVEIFGEGGSRANVDVSGSVAADTLTELSGYDRDFGTLDARSVHDMPPSTSGGQACTECLRTEGHKLQCSSGGRGSTPEPERLHANMGDEPIVASPSGEYGFYMPVGGSERPESIAKHGPIIQVAQLVRDGSAWSPTPARFHASSVSNFRDGASLAIDMGADWKLSAQDTQALAEFARTTGQQQPPAAAKPGAAGDAASRPINDNDRVVAKTIYDQIPFMARGNMDAKATNAHPVPNGIKMRSCLAGRKRVDVTIVLNGSDTYDIDVVTSQTLRADSKPVAATTDVHVAQLERMMYLIGDGRPQEIAR